MNRSAITLGLLGSFGLAGCQGTPNPPPPTAPPIADRVDREEDAAVTPTLAWSAPLDGLSIALELPPGRQPPGGALTATLHVKNVGAEPRRIYLLEPERFRSFQSRFAVRTADGTPVMATPGSPPHGYLPRESDFPLIGPGEERRFSQTLPLHDPALAAGGRVTVTWTYENAITAWQGGIQTLDGPTQPLFGGGPIPGIWVGELSVSAVLELGAAAP